MNARSGASLAACQKGAIAPTPVAVAIRIVSDAASSLNQLHGSISPDAVFVGYDGDVRLLDVGSVGKDAESNARAGYLAPEQVTGGEVDRRADVFAFGVILWELLTGTRLFARGTAAETRVAIAEDPVLDVRDVNPDVPAAISEVVRSALARAPAARFGTTTAFCNALASARAASEMEDVENPEIAEWVAQCGGPSGPARSPASAGPARIEPPTASITDSITASVLTASVPDLDVRGANRSHRSQTSMEAVRVPAQVPSPFEVPPVMSAAPPSSGRSGQSSSQRLLSAAPAVASPHDSGGGRTLSFDDDDDDEDEDFDMQIERNLTGGSLQPATGNTLGPATPRHSSGLHATGGTSRGRVAGTGLEMGVASRMAREDAAERYSELPGVAGMAASYALAGVVMGGVCFALFQSAHRAGGRDVTSFAPHAFDGTSAPESGALALLSVVVAVAIGFIAMRLKPTAWVLVASAGAMLLLALAMVTVTLASTGENPTPPDGVLLVPYLLPAAFVLLGFGICGRAARLFADGRTKRRVASIPLAALAGAILFAAFEVSRFAR